MSNDFEPYIKSTDAVEQHGPSFIPYPSGIKVDPRINGGQGVSNLSFSNWKRNIIDALPKHGNKYVWTNMLSNFLNIVLGFMLSLTYENYTTTHLLITSIVVIAIIIIFFLGWNENSVSAKLLNSVIQDMNKFEEPGENNNAN